MQKTKAYKIYKKISENFDILKCELNFSSPYQLLIAVILSAQCTDRRVNNVTNELFKIAPTPEKLVKLSLDKIEMLIFSCGFYKNKAQAILKSSTDIIEKFNGQVPNTMEKLLSLRGVGRKTASVVLAEAFNIPAIAVDTHCFRVSNRLELTNSTTPEQTEEQLKNLFNLGDWKNLHYALVLFGRYICKSQNPKCNQCNVKEYCKFYKEIK